MNEIVDISQMMVQMHNPEGKPYHVDLNSIFRGKHAINGLAMSKEHSMYWARDNCKYCIDALRAKKFHVKLIFFRIYVFKKVWVIYQGELIQLA